MTVFHPCSQISCYWETIPQPSLELESLLVHWHKLATACLKLFLCSFQPFEFRHCCCAHYQIPTWCSEAKQLSKNTQSEGPRHGFESENLSQQLDHSSHSACPPPWGPALNSLPTPSQICTQNASHGWHFLAHDKGLQSSPCGL